MHCGCVELMDLRFVYIVEPHAGLISENEESRRRLVCFISTCKWRGTVEHRESWYGAGWISRGKWQCGGSAETGMWFG